MPQPTPSPPRRTIAFADAVRRRRRPRAVRPLGRDWAARGGYPSTIEQLPRRTRRAVVVHRHRHTGHQLRLRLAVVMAAGRGLPAASPRTVTPTAAAQVARGVRLAVPRTPPAAPPQHPAGIRLRVLTMTAPGPKARLPEAPPIALRALSGRQEAVATTAPQRLATTERPAGPVPMVHRAALPVHPAVSRGVAGTNPPQPPSVRWLDNAAPPAGVTPLTAADLPSVVDRVVGEIDRRVTAARERRGWTG